MTNATAIKEAVDQLQFSIGRLLFSQNLTKDMEDVIAKIDALVTTAHDVGREEFVERYGQLQKRYDDQYADAMIAHRWFARVFGEHMNGRDFAVKCEMANNARAYMAPIEANSGDYVRRASAMLDAHPLFDVPKNEWAEVCEGLLTMVTGTFTAIADVKDIQFKDTPVNVSSFLWEVVPGDEEDSWGIRRNGEGVGMSVAQMLWKNEAERIVSLNNASIDSDASKCGLCHGPYQFDTSIPSAVWNSVVRADGLPEYLCLSCITRIFAAKGISFTATLSGDDLTHVPIEVRVGGQASMDMEKVTQENNELRCRVRELEEKQDPRAEEWKRGALDAATGQPCATDMSIAYEDGWDWFHNNDVARIMAQRIGAIANRASKSETALAEANKNLRKAYEAGWRSKPHDYERMNEMNQKFDQFLKSLES